MASIGMITFVGKSGTKYDFKYYDFSGEWNNVAGIYVVGKYDKTANQISPLYVGETDNLQERFSNHHKQDCFDKNKANVLCWLGEKVSKTRLTIETDLIESLKPSCND